MDSSHAGPRRLGPALNWSEGRQLAGAISVPPHAPPNKRVGFFLFFFFLNYSVSFRLLSFLFSSQPLTHTAMISSRLFRVPQSPKEKKKGGLWQPGWVSSSAIWWHLLVHVSSYTPPVDSRSLVRWTPQLWSCRLSISPRWAELDGRLLQMSSCTLRAARFFSPPCLEVSTLRKIACIKLNISSYAEEPNIQLWLI